MNRLIATGLAMAAIVAAGSVAQARPDTRDMSCAEVHELVLRAGAITLSTGPRTYQRFVADQGFCLRMEAVQPAYAPTVDAAQCFVGQRCESITFKKMQD